MHILEQHHQQERDISSVRLADARLEDGVEHTKGERPHVEGAHNHALNHQPVEDWLTRIAGRPLELVSLGWFECERDVLYAVCDQVEPQELQRKQGQRQVKDEGAWFVERGDDHLHVDVVKTLVDRLDPSSFSAETSIETFRLTWLSLLTRGTTSIRMP